MFDAHRPSLWPTSRVSRREFLQRSAAATAAAGLTTLSARAYSQVAGSNDRIRIGAIGVGTMGYDHVHRLANWQSENQHNIEIGALCDVYRPRLDRAGKRAGTGADLHMDYRRLLDNKSLDAVLVATPDHWHAKLAMEACDAGKHVYLEKPMCHTIEQAQALVDTVEKSKRIVQVGVQSCSLAVLDQLRDHIQKGDFGKLVMINGSYCRNNVAGQWRDYGSYDPDAKPGPDLDWDMWLGSRWNLAPQRPWHAPRFFQFRCYWDYSGGVATDLFFHTLAHLIKATGVGYPDRVVSAGGIWVFGRDYRTQPPGQPVGQPDDREVPDMYNTMIDYPGGPTVTLLGSMVNNEGIADVIATHDATIRLDDDHDTAEIIPQTSGKKPIGKVKEKITLKGDGRQDQGTHWLNFFACIRNNTPQKLNCPVELGLRTQVPISMGVMAYRQQRVIRWDPEKKQAVPAA